MLYFLESRDKNRRILFLPSSQFKTLSLINDSTLTSRNKKKKIIFGVHVNHRNGSFGVKDVGLCYAVDNNRCIAKRLNKPSRRTIANENKKKEIHNHRRSAERKDELLDSSICMRDYPRGATVYSQINAKGFLVDKVIGPEDETLKKNKSSMQAVRQRFRNVYTFGEIVAILPPVFRRFSVYTNICHYNLHARNFEAL